ncbi:raffinose synthase family protein [Wolffia australiana]
MAAASASAAPRLIRRGRSPPSTVYNLFSSASNRHLRFRSSTNSSPFRLPPIGFASAFRVRSFKAAGTEMTIAQSVHISDDGRLVVGGSTVLTGVPDSVNLSSASDAAPVDGVFIGPRFPHAASRHVVSLGVLRGVRFMACFRFKLWWMSQRMGDRGREVPLETQFLLLEVKGASFGETKYSVFLPLVEGAFRASLQGGDRDELELCVESGDAATAAASFSSAVFVGGGHADPFAAVSAAVAAARTHLQTFLLREEKQLPPIVDLFGWCTWDAFYQDVSQEGVEAGLRTLVEGGAPPKFVIIDDGWQSVSGDSLMRLSAIKENSKFQSEENPEEGIRSIVGIAKKRYGLSHVYVWHAMAGYWGGVHPAASAMASYGPELKFPEVSPGVVGNEPGMKTDPLTVMGLGIMTDPAKTHQFYDELHGYLAASGVDGVKVDVQSILETLGSGLGGRVELNRLYHQALDASVKKNFPENGIIACMSHSSDSIYHSKQTAVVRASDDFYPRDPASHTIHIASVAYNSVFLGEFMLPDWDMFHSLHPAAEYHASARAISGGPVYVSDAPGKHNFELLRKLVLPDGSILRARLPARPTKDCLFSDPTRDGISLLKIWNMNKHTGVIGVYNCQGAAWCSAEKKNVFHETNGDALTTSLRSSDVHVIGDVAPEPAWTGTCAVYRHGGGLFVLPGGAAVPVSLKILQHEIFVVSPVMVFSPELKFAPLGLIDMFNAGGAVQGLLYDVPLQRVSMEIKGCGRLGAYSASRPTRCFLGSLAVDFSYDSSSGLLLIDLPAMPAGGKKLHRVVVDL